MEIAHTHDSGLIETIRCAVCGAVKIDPEAEWPVVYVVRPEGTTESRDWFCSEACHDQWRGDTGKPGESGGLGTETG